MTIVAIWEEDKVLWAAADTRISAGLGSIRTDSGSKLLSIPIRCMMLSPDGSLRVPHYWTSYGFAYSGAVLPATMTAITASNLLTNLVTTVNNRNPPLFRDVAELFRKLAERFNREHFASSATQDALFSGALFAWCPYCERYLVANMVAHVVGQNVDVHLSNMPKNDDEPRLLLGSGRQAFHYELLQIRGGSSSPTPHAPLEAIKTMIVKNTPEIGGALSLGVTDRDPLGFQLLFPITPSSSHSTSKRYFNGIDLDSELGPVGHYQIGGQ